MKKTKLDKLKELLTNFDIQLQKTADEILDSVQDNVNDVYFDMSKYITEHLNDIDNNIRRKLERNEYLIEGDYEVIEEKKVDINLEKEEEIPEKKIEINMEKK